MKLVVVTLLIPGGDMLWQGVDTNVERAVWHINEKLVRAARELRLPGSRHTRHLLSPAVEDGNFVQVFGEQYLVVVREHELPGH